MTKIICDTNALLFWADAPERLSDKAAKILNTDAPREHLACSDITFWEIAMLFTKGRLNPSASISPADYTRQIVSALQLRALAITPEIAELSQHSAFTHGDPADRIIAATAIHHHLPLVTSDKRLRQLDMLETIW